MEGPKYTKQTKTAEELEAMILEDLSLMDGCPQSGITVTVLWYSMEINADVWHRSRSRAQQGRVAKVL